VQVPRNSRKLLEERQVGVSEDIKGRDRLGRTGDPVQGGSDWFDVLSATSVLGGFELLDKMRAGWACAVDIHKVERRPGEGIK
jgi:hypothetical protein